MRLRILGSNGTYPTAGRPCSGYLVEAGETRLWIDAGYGTFAALQQFGAMNAIDGILLSHVHADHCIDVLAYYHAVRYGESAWAATPTFVPEGLAERLRGFLGSDDHPIGTVLDFRVLGENSTVALGELTVTTTIGDHSVPTLGVRVEADGRSLVYSADTGPAGGVPDLAQGANLLLCEASYQGATADKPWPHHLTAAEAGTLARTAGVDRLILTHIWPTLDRSRSIEEAESTFGRPVELAVPGMKVKV